MSRLFKALSATPLVLAAGLSLAACSDAPESRTTQSRTTHAGATPTDTGASSKTAIPAPALTAVANRLGTLDLSQPLRVMGTEPFWSLDITPASLTFTPMEGARQVANNSGPVVQGDMATWSSQTQAGVAVQVVTTLKDCSDGMSDRIYPLSAAVKVGANSFTGCAASLRALESAGESGRVE
jgi:uncharacterized membrane protein